MVVLFLLATLNQLLLHLPRDLEDSIAPADFQWLLSWLLCCFCHCSHSAVSGASFTVLTAQPTLLEEDRKVLREKMELENQVMWVAGTELSSSRVAWI